MAKKSFKKGVKNVIDSIDNDKKPVSEKKPAITKPKAKPAATARKRNEPEQKTIEFNLGSRFVVQEVSSGMDLLKTALANRGDIVISSDVVTEMDVSYMQMILAFDKAAKEKKLNVTWQLKFSDDIMKSLNNSGICEILTPFIDDSMAEIVGNG
jgi:hypothetical protein